MHPHPEDSKSWHEEFVKKLSGEEHVVKVTVNRKTDDTVEPCANDRENVMCVAEKLAGSSKEACGSTHHGSRGTVENNQWTEFDNSWDLMSRRTN